MSAPNGNDTTGTGPKTIAVPQAQRGEVVRKGFGTEELERSPETAATALAAQARAAIESRFIMAMQRPRNIETVRTRILAACVRPFFADTAVYSKPVGKKLNRDTGEWEQQYAEGLSIRFAEEVIRCFGNAMTETTTIYDDAERRIVRAAATDFETNVVHFKDLIIDKTVERKVLKKGQAPLGKRENSYGDIVFIVAATEDEFTVKVGAHSAKGLRDKILMLIPSDIKEEGKALCFKTNADQDAVDPEAARRKVIDSFAKVGVSPDQLADLLGHNLETILPAELQQLRAFYAAISEGETTWREIIEQKRDFEREKAAGSQAPGAQTTVTPDGKKDLGGLAADAKAKREAATKPGPAGQTTIPTGAAKPPATPKPPEREPGADEEDKGDAPTDDDDLPPSMGGKGKPTPRRDDGSGIR